MRYIEVFDPTSTPRVTERPLAARTGSLVGETIGFLCNRKNNAGLLLESIERELRARIGDFAAVKADKGAAEPAPNDVIERLRRCHAVVTAVAD